MILPYLRWLEYQNWLKDQPEKPAFVLHWESLQGGHALLMDSIREARRLLVELDEIDDEETVSERQI